MGERLVHEVLDFAPDALTTPERLALVALAVEADDETRRCPKGVSITDRFSSRLHVTETDRLRLLTSLLDKGILMVMGGEYVIRELDEDTVRRAYLRYHGAG